MVDEILPDLYRIEVPLPRNPLKATNSYVLKSATRNLIVDTGMNRPECDTALRTGLHELEVDLAETDVFVTHMHADHLGLAADLAEDRSRIYFNRQDAEILGRAEKWREMLELAGMNGFPEDQLDRALSKHPGRKYTLKRRAEFTFVRDGDTLSCGEYSFRCIHTPGHTRGHTCLYEPDRRLLIAGDHILVDITPNISSWLHGYNPLAAYLNSLDLVSRLDIDTVLPGHRRIFTDCTGRIDELKRHHHDRVDEVLGILENGPMNAFNVAGQMRWDMSYESWADFPVTQKWFATGEALAHIKYLEDKGLVRRETVNKTIVFHPA